MENEIFNENINLIKEYFYISDFEIEKLKDFDHKTNFRNSIIDFMMDLTKYTNGIPELLKTTKLTKEMLLEMILIPYNIYEVKDNILLPYYKEIYNKKDVKMIDKHIKTSLSYKKKNKRFNLHLICSDNDNQDLRNMAEVIALEIQNKIKDLTVLHVKDAVGNKHGILRLLRKDKFIVLFNTETVELQSVFRLKKFDYCISYFVEDDMRSFNAIKIDDINICESVGYLDRFKLIDLIINDEKKAKFLKELFTNTKYPISDFKRFITPSMLFKVKELIEDKVLKSNKEILHYICNLITVEEYFDYEELDFFKYLDEYEDEEMNDNNSSSKKNSKKKEIEYKYEYSNTDLPLEDIKNTIKKEKRDIKLLFHGITGTGKSEFAKVVGNELGYKVEIIKVSDILSKWVGESESNLKEYFKKDYNNSKKILVFDEIDSFISHRSGNNNATHNIQLTNEFLLQLENYTGIFIGTTNLVDNIDTAFMRRFDLKVKFDYMKREHIIEMISILAEELNIQYTDDEMIDVSKLKLTPAIIKLIKRQNRFSKIKDFEDLYKRLKSESEYICNEEGNKIGFFK